MESIIPNDEKGVCWVCGRVCATHKHHIFGAANRANSERHGLFVHLCPPCHNMGDRGVHFNRELMEHLHREGQAAFERVHGSREDFMRIFGKNYL